MMPRRKKPIVGVVLTFLIAAGTPGAGDQVAQPAATSCDYSCLSKAMADFANALTSRTPGAIRLSDSAEIRENARVVQLEGTAWQKVKGVRSGMTFADVVTGNVVSRAGVELLDGKAGYISTRLKIGPAVRITDVELSVEYVAQHCHLLCLEL
jgi:hypothetical protein